jgi:predicted deacylase
MPATTESGDVQARGNLVKTENDALIYAIDQPPLPDPGEKRRGILTFSHPTLAGWEWPFVVARGLTEGPFIALLSGVHAGEYPPIVANIRFMRELDPTTFRGSIVSIPVVDPPAFYARSAFVCPIDGKNPNRCFPGTPTGTFSDVLAHAIFSNVIQRATHLIDLHCGDVFEHLAPFTICRRSGNAHIDEVALGMAKAFALPFVVATEPGPITLPGTTSAASAAAGIPAITSEAGGRGLLTEPETQMQLRGTANVLRYLGAFDGEPEPTPGQRTCQASTAFLAPVEGLWFPEVSLTDNVTAGQHLGRIENLFGDPLTEITAASDGTILYLTSSPAVREGGILGSIGVA